NQLLDSFVGGVSKKEIQRPSGDQRRIPVIGLTFVVRVRVTAPVARLITTSERLLASSTLGLRATIKANSSPAGDQANSRISKSCFVTWVVLPSERFTTHKREYLRLDSGRTIASSPAPLLASSSA